MIETIRPSELPRDLIDEISKDVSDFLIGLVKLDETGSIQDATLAGSGTLVHIEGIHGILTAHHVLSNLSKDGEIGLILATRFGAQLHRYTIPSQVIHRLEIAKGQIESEGPDLAMLIIPPVEIERLKAYKSFYNLSGRRERMLANPLDNNEGIWFLCGFADELTSEAPPEAGYDRVKVFRGICGAGGVKREYSVGDFDYYDFEVRYGGINESPESFGGFSGGGLWQVPLIRAGNGELRAKELVLLGVAFYQTDRKDNRRFIKCHGRLSVYQHVIETVKRVAP